MRVDAWICSASEAQNVGMLSIPRDQFEHLGADQKQRFVAALTARLRRDHPQPTQPMSDADVAALIDTATRRAALYGLTAEAHVRFYAGLMLRQGHDFDVDPAMSWAGEILEDDGIGAHDKVARLDEVLVFLERGAAA